MNRYSLSFAIAHLPYDACGIAIKSVHFDQGKWQISYFSHSEICREFGKTENGPIEYRVRGLTNSRNNKDTYSIRWIMERIVPTSELAGEE